EHRGRVGPPPGLLAGIFPGLSGGPSIARSQRRPSAGRRTGREEGVHAVGDKFGTRIKPFCRVVAWGRSQRQSKTLAVPLPALFPFVWIVGRWVKILQNNAGLVAAVGQIHIPGNARGDSEEGTRKKHPGRLVNETVVHRSPGDCPTELERRPTGWI